MERERFFGSLGWTITLLGAFMVGCRRGPEPPPRPQIDPTQAAAEAIRLYDKNGTGLLEPDEWKQSPPLAAAKDRIDQNKDGNLSSQEIADRITSWLQSPAIMTTCAIVVTLDGKPLEGATITLEPETFLGSSYKTGSGTTDLMGMASITGQGEKFSGLYLGLYRVKVSKQLGGRETIPARYNTQTELGCELATDIGGIGYIQFDLKSR
ncbi:MAG: hypothetical protein NZ602_13040 [Thermoguttaceae bacterium]|nr:hypothetical protein [Thermoguttaceae bacterium]MDW8038902.1 hypothetical protein [Thermoguttaceae bacterium]